MTFGDELLKIACDKLVEHSTKASKDMKQVRMNYEQRNRASVPFIQGSKKYRIKGDR